MSISDDIYEINFIHFWLMNKDSSNQFHYSILSKMLVSYYV